MKAFVSDLGRFVLPRSWRKEMKTWPCKARYMIRVISGRPHTILCYPHIPRNIYVISRLCAQKGFIFTGNPDKKFHFVINWQDRTFGITDEKFASLSRKYPMINRKCLNISKSHVDEVFKDVFGYSSLVDPLAHEGVCVKKSDFNAKHDGKILQCPVDVMEEGYVYQKLIDNIYDEKHITEYRVPIFADNIPFVYQKFKLLEDRFGFSVKAEILNANVAFSDDELKKIVQFCGAIGLDCGEMDIIRDKTDGRIYIVDANNTPTVYLVGLSDRERQRILKLQSSAFEDMLLSLFK